MSRCGEAWRLSVGCVSVLLQHKSSSPEGIAAFSTSLAEDALIPTSVWSCGLTFDLSWGMFPDSKSNCSRQQLLISFVLLCWTLFSLAMLSELWLETTLCGLPHGVMVIVFCKEGAIPPTQLVMQCLYLFLFCVLIWHVTHTQLLVLALLLQIFVEPMAWAGYEMESGTGDED